MRSLPLANGIGFSPAPRATLASLWLEALSSWTRQPSAGYNTALVFSSKGRLLDTFRKLHIPEEPGFWETSHYSAGTEPARVITGAGLPIGIQICSDANRPEGSHLLGALGAEAILTPRATERRTYERWKTVFRANALTSAAYTLSVNRPRPEAGVLIGGSSIAVAPDGTVLVETTDPIALCRIDHAVVRQARKDYPGYLPVRAGLYATAWNNLAEVQRATRKKVS